MNYYREHYIIQIHFMYGKVAVIKVSHALNKILNKHFQEINCVIHLVVEKPSHATWKTLKKLKILPLDCSLHTVGTVENFEYFHYICICLQGPLLAG